MTDDAFSLDSFLPYLLNQAAERASARFADVYKSRYGLLRTDWRVLFHLGRFGQMTARDIGARTHEDKTRISRSVARLEGRGFLTREADPEDRRAERLSLTDAGRKVFADLSAEAAAHDAALAAKIGARDMAVLKGMLEKLTRAA